MKVSYGYVEGAVGQKFGLWLMIHMMRKIKPCSQQDASEGHIGTLQPNFAGGNIRELGNPQVGKYKVDNFGAVRMSLTQLRATRRRSGL